MKYIIDLLYSLLAFIGNTLKGLATFVVNIPSMLDYLTTSISVIPPIYITYITISIALYVIFSM